MVYASCKESVIDNTEKKFGIHFEKKVNRKSRFILSIEIFLVGNL